MYTNNQSDKGGTASRRASSQLAQNQSPWTKAGHPFAAVSISFLACRQFTAVPRTHCSMYTQLSGHPLGAFLRGEDRNHL